MGAHRPVMRIPLAAPARRAPVTNRRLSRQTNAPNTKSIVHGSLRIVTRVKPVV
jgi:hypothetical protein